MHVTRVWAKDDPHGMEIAEIDLGRDRLSARGFAIGTEPEPYRLEYDLTTAASYVTQRLIVRAQGHGWHRTLELRRDPAGPWSFTTEQSGAPELGPPGGDMAALAGSLDCDLGLSPLTNSMPVLRHRLHEGGEEQAFLMAWVSVPALEVTAARQWYRFVRRAAARVVGFDDGSFQAEIDFDENGLVTSYPGIARRVA
jgi:hypothetical protein